VTNANNGNATDPNLITRARQQRLRAREPDVRTIVEDVGPRMLEDAFERTRYSVPDEWKQLVDSLQNAVRAEADKDAADADSTDTDTIEERRGFHWSLRIRSVSAMLEYLMREIRRDLGIDDGQTIASMLLVTEALTRLQIELHDGSTKEGRGDGEENQCRVYRALRALVPKFDDIQLRRFRALQFAELAAKATHLPTPEEVERRVAGMGGNEDQGVDDLEHRREFISVDLPLVDALFTRSRLGDIDERFMSLDPLVVLEEFNEASASRCPDEPGPDGVAVGPVRALARLAVMCGALEYGPRDGEPFDEAVDRARGNLLTTRWRLRKEMRAFALGA
jgi:hypothetical protein